MQPVGIDVGQAAQCCFYDVDGQLWPATCAPLSVLSGYASQKSFLHAMAQLSPAEEGMQEACIALGTMLAAALRSGLHIVCLPGSNLRSSTPAMWGSYHPGQLSKLLCSCMNSRMPICCCPAFLSTNAQ